MRKRRTVPICAALGVGALLAASRMIVPQVGAAQTSCFFCTQVWISGEGEGYYHDDEQVFFNDMHGGVMHSGGWWPGSCSNWHTNYAGSGGGGGGDPKT